MFDLDSGAPDFFIVGAFDAKSGRFAIIGTAWDVLDAEEQYRLSKFAGAPSAKRVIDPVYLGACR